MEDQYYDIERRTAVKEEARMFRRKLLTYEQAEVIYSISHRKLRDLAEAAGAFYKIGKMTRINRNIFDEYLRAQRRVPRIGGKLCAKS